MKLVRPNERQGLKKLRSTELLHPETESSEKDFDQYLKNLAERFKSYALGMLARHSSGPYDRLSYEAPIFYLYPETVDRQPDPFSFEDYYQVYSGRSEMSWLVPVLVRKFPDKRGELKKKFKYFDPSLTLKDPKDAFAALFLVPEISTKVRDLHGPNSTRMVQQGLDHFRPLDLRDLGLYAVMIPGARSAIQELVRLRAGNIRELLDGLLNEPRNLWTVLNYLIDLRFILAEEVTITADGELVVKDKAGLSRGPVLPERSLTD